MQDTSPIFWWLGVIAVGLPLPLVLHFLSIGLGRLRLRQRTNSDGQRIKAIAHRDGFVFELEVLCDLGFRAAGAHESWLSGIDRAIEQLVFTHSELPIVCLLSNRYGVRCIEMRTDDGVGRFLITKNHDPLKLECDHPDLYVQVADVSRVEDLFAAHVRALQVWKDDGFLSVRVEGLADFQEQAARFMLQPRYRWRLRFELLLGGVFGVSCLCWLAPLPIVWLVSVFLAGGAWALDGYRYGVILCSLSIFISCHCYWLLLFKSVSPRKRRPSKQNRINVGFEDREPTAVGYQVFEFTNQAWEAGLQRWWIRAGSILLLLYAAALLVGWTTVGFGAALVSAAGLGLLTPARECFPCKLVGMLKDDHIRVELRSLLGMARTIVSDADLVLSLEDIVDMRVEESWFGSKHLSVEYVKVVEELTSWGNSVKRVSCSGRLSLVDSLGGFDVDKIIALHAELRQAWQQRLRQIQREGQKACGRQELPIVAGLNDRST